MVAQRELSRRILDGLKRNIAEPNLEAVLHVVEELEALAQSLGRAPATMRPFLESTFGDIGAQTLSAERFELMEAIGVSFAGINYDESWRPLYSLLRPLLDVFDMDIFTLNYDLLPDVVTVALSVLSGKRWFDGPLWWILRLKGALAIRVLVVIASYADKHGEAFPSLRTISAHLGISERRAIEGVKALRAAGIVQRTRRWRDSNLYRLALKVPGDRHP